MRFVPIAQRSCLMPLFDGWQETMIWSCLQGYMGDAWCDNLEAPQSVRLIVGDFCFFAGKPDSSFLPVVSDKPVSPCLILVPRTKNWTKLIEETYPSSVCEKTVRYALQKNTFFDLERLERFRKELPPEVTIQAIDEKWYLLTRQEPWAKDLCRQFPTYEDYRRWGLGFVALYQGKPVSGASSYTVYDKGIEIEIDTKEGYRRRGLALACAAELILACLRQERYPSWDAANIGSLRLAEKLGYRLDSSYSAYYLFSSTD